MVCIEFMFQFQSSPVTGFSSISVLDTVPDGYSPKTHSETVWRALQNGNALIRNIAFEDVAVYIRAGDGMHVLLKDNHSSSDTIT